METIFITTLVSHILLGIIAVFLMYIGSLHLLKKIPEKTLLMKIYLGAALGLLLSWASGAYYYVLYYGGSVKPRIIEGTYPWAHQVFMEAKEHIFIFLPFMALTVWFAIRSDDGLLESGERKSLIRLAITATALGVFVALAGIIISGAVQ